MKKSKKGELGSAARKHPWYLYVLFGVGLLSACAGLFPEFFPEGQGFRGQPYSPPQRMAVGLSMVVMSVFGYFNYFK